MVRITKMIRIGCEIVGHTDTVFFCFDFSYILNAMVIIPFICLKTNKNLNCKGKFLFGFHKILRSFFAFGLDFLERRVYNTPWTKVSPMEEDMAKVYEDLPKRLFLKINRAFVINFRYIDKL